MLAGSRDHEEVDAQAFADWGVDFLKYDNCWAPASDWVIDRYTAMSTALNKTGRPIVYSMCDWGVGNPWLWAPQVLALLHLYQRRLPSSACASGGATLVSGAQEWVTSISMTARCCNQLAKTALVTPNFASADRKLMAHHRRCGTQLGERVALPGMSSSCLLEC